MFLARSLRIASVLAALLSLSAFSYADDGASRSEELRQIIRFAHRAIQQNEPALALEVVRHAADGGSADPLVPAAKEAASAESALGKKLLSLQRAAERRIAHGHRSAAEPDAAGAVLWLDGDSSPGIHCQRALMTEPTRALLIRLDASGEKRDEVWLRWRAPMAGAFAVVASSRDADASLSVYTDCAESSPIASNDDHIGLDAQLVLHAGHAGQVFMVKVENAGDAGILEISSTATKTISGTVTDSVGAPVPQLIVHATGAGGSDAGAAVTDMHGHYQIALSPFLPGPHKIRTGQDGAPRYLHEAWNDAPCVSPYAYRIDDCAGASDIELGASASVEDIDFVLGPGAELVGRVVSAADGLPIANAAVWIRTELGTPRSTLTDGSGRYRFRGLLPGMAVTISASHEAFDAEFHDNVPCEQGGCDQLGASFVVIQDGSTSIDFELQPNAYIDVALRLSTAIPSYLLAEFTVRDLNGTVVPASYGPLADGRYRVGPLSPGSYLLGASIPWMTFRHLYADIDCASDCAQELSRATPIGVEVGGEPSIEMGLKLLPKLRGRVTDAGTGQPVAAVVRAAGSQPYSTVGEASTDSDGYYIVTITSPGEYLVFVDAPGYIDQAYPAIDCEISDSFDTCTGMGRLSFDLDSGDRTVNFALRRSPTVTGHLFGDGKPLGVGYVHGADAIALIGPGRDYVHGTSLSYDIESGFYSLTDFADGEYFIGARVHGYYGQLADKVDCPNEADLWDCPFQHARTFSLADAGSNIDFDLRGLGVQYVHVTDSSSQQPLAGIGIDVWDTEGRSLGTFSTSSTGRATISGQDAVLLSTDNYIGYIDQVHSNIACPEGSSVYRGGCSLAGAHPVTLPSMDPSGEPVFFAMHKGVVVFENGFD